VGLTDEHQRQTLPTSAALSVPHPRHSHLPRAALALASWMARTASIHRTTAETDIRLELSIDGSGKSTISTGVAFLDHMLTLFAKHGLFDLKVEAKGDIEVDFHHTVEDVGIVLGQAFRDALGGKEGIRRYGWCLLPMDETLASVALDLSGRPLLVYVVPERVDTIGIGFHFQLVEEFMRGFTTMALANIHLEIVRGRDAHHMAEALFKGLAKAMDQATQADPRITGVLSTKNML
jgi:imidazoleglycerol-phosphate dehydratase